MHERRPDLGIVVVARRDHRDDRAGDVVGYIFREYEGFAFADDITGTIIPVISPRDDDYPEIRASFVHDSSIFA
ncbi:MAG: hypothetical protein AAF772_04635, partial [Acidobacteriota bacterium]